MRALLRRIDGLFSDEGGYVRPKQGVELTEEQILAPVYWRGDRWIKIFLLGHAVLALSLAAVHHTWLSTLVTVTAVMLVFWLSVKFWPGSFLTRCMGGMCLAVFVSLHIFQMQGLAEMHFLFFTAITMMIVYADWRCLGPAALFIFVQHTAFAVLQNSGMPLYFYDNYKIASTKLAFHFGVLFLEVSLVGTWAWLNRRHLITDQRGRQRLTEQQSELEQQLERVRRSEALLETDR